MVLRRLKGGSGTDILFVMPFLLAFILVAIFAFTLTSQFNDAIQDTGGVLNDPNATQVHSTTTDALRLFDGGFLIIIVGFTVSGFLAGILLPNNPAFYIMGFFVLAFGVIFAGPFADIYTEFIGVTQIAAIAGNFSTVTALMNFFPVIITVMGAVFLLGLVLKGRFAGDEGGL